MRQCRVPGCQRPASSRFSIYCVQHKAKHRRHGAVNQTGVTKHELKPYLAQVQARIERNKDKPLLDALLARWRAVVSVAEGIATEWSRGKPTVRQKRLAAQEVLKLHHTVDARHIIGTVLAMYLMQDQEPRRFADERAFRTQLVRRVRGLTTLNATTSFDPETGREKRVYRELSPRVTAIVASWLVEALGVAGLHFAKLEKRDHERKQRELLAFHQTLEEMS